MSKTWLITGASSGLGRQMTSRLLARGDRVVATVRKQSALADLQHQYGGALAIMNLDVTDTARIRTVMRDAFSRWDRIDVIVSNAGYGLFGAAEEVSDEQIDHQIATNLTGAIQVIRAALPHLRAQDGGRIVQVSSEGGQISYPNFSLYHASKWGIEGFVESVAQEVAPFGIDFIIVEPGPTSTNFGAGLIRPAAMSVYDDTPAGAVRQAMDSGSFVIKGDAARTVDAIITAADTVKPPLRLTLGSIAYGSISQALAARLTALEAQREIALSADCDAQELD